MDTELINIFNEVINKKYNKTNHKTYYSNEYYLTNIFEMLNDINKWVRCRDTNLATLGNS